MGAVLLVAGLTTTVAAGAAFVIGMRRQSPLVQGLVRRASRSMKPLVLRSAGRAGSPTAVVAHVGRTSGRRYETPVVAAATATGFVIALPYGRTADWLENVMRSGGATLRLDGRVHSVGDPVVVPLDTVSHHFARREQLRQRRFRVREAVVLRSR